MAQQEPLDFSQPENELSAIAEAQRAKLFPKNNFKKDNPYSSVNPDAIADGDDQGKGTGVFLDVYNQNAGAIQDVLERKTQTVVNEYKPNAPYKIPTE
jgi:hypothetical protein